MQFGYCKSLLSFLVAYRRNLKPFNAEYTGTGHKYTWIKMKNEWRLKLRMTWLLKNPNLFDI